MRATPLLLLLLVLGACGRGPTTLGLFGDRDLVVRSGTSFGMCLGHCLTELSVAEGEMVLTRTSREPDRHPPIVERRAIERGEWEALVALADAGRFAGLQEVYGCPDCADGGAEWVELERDGERRRVTFEHGGRVEAIQPLIETMRELRGRFPEP